mmetsp:Transcript_81947/g.228397  ORF Transcript_81947/g.228397 Transcript_81947/m.228397 type:complete len:203 (+) Transcript_81947:315-923(+)
MTCSLCNCSCCISSLVLCCTNPTASCLILASPALTRSSCASFAARSSPRPSLSFKYSRTRSAITAAPSSVRMKRSTRRRPSSMHLSRFSAASRSAWSRSSCSCASNSVNLSICMTCVATMSSPSACSLRGASLCESLWLLFVSLVPLVPAKLHVLACPADKVGAGTGIFAKCGEKLHSATSVLTRRCSSARCRSRRCCSAPT